MAFKNTCKIVKWDPQNAKRSSPKKCMGYLKMHGFMATPYMILEIVGIYRVILILGH